MRRKSARPGQTPALSTAPPNPRNAAHVPLQAPQRPPCSRELDGWSEGVHRAETHAEGECEGCDAV